MIHVECLCGTTFEVADSYAGKRLRCPTCREYLTAGADSAVRDRPPRPPLYVDELPSKPPLERRPIGERADDRRDRDRDRGSGCVLAVLCVLLLLVAVGAVAMWWWYLTGEEPEGTHAKATNTQTNLNGGPGPGPQGKPPLYTVAFAVPSLIGDVRDVKVTMEAKGTSVMTPQNGPAVKNAGGTGPIVFQGRVKTVAVDPVGRATAQEFTVVSLTQRGQAVESPGAVYIAELGKGPPSFRRKGGRPGEGLPPWLPRILMEAGADGGMAEDLTFGTPDPKAVGDSWLVNKEMAAQSLQRIGMPTAPEGISGGGKLVNAVNQGGTLFLDVESAVTLKVTGSFKGPQGDVGREGTLRLSVQIRVPADYATGPVKKTSKLEAKMTFKALAGPRAGEVEEKHDEETLTTETTYYRAGVRDAPPLALPGSQPPSKTAATITDNVTAVRDPGTGVVRVKLA